MRLIMRDSVHAWGQDVYGEYICLLPLNVTTYPKILF